MFCVWDCYAPNGWEFFLRKWMTDTARNILFVPLIFLFISLLPAEEIEFSLTSSYDESLQKAVLFIPDTHGPDHARPLLVIAHYMGVRPQTLD